MYKLRQPIPKPEQNTGLKQEMDVLKLQVFALQQKNQSAKEEIKALHEQLARQQTRGNETSQEIKEHRNGQTEQRHVPYVFEVTTDNKSDIVKGSSYFYYIEDDESRGLGSPGRSGYIKNDGPGDITYRMYDKIQDTWSYPAVIKAGESDKFEYSDNIRVNALEVVPNSSGTMYRLRFTAGEYRGTV